MRRAVVVVVGTIAALCATSMAVIISMTVYSFWTVAKEAHEKLDRFRALPPSEFDLLIEVAGALVREVGDQEWVWPGGPREPAVPPELVAFGFDRVEVRGIVEGRSYWLFDSGSFARIDPGSDPATIKIVTGDSGEFVEQVYQRRSNKTHQHNAGDRPSMNDSPASDTPSSPAPRG
jgi:hypothetical protein